MEKEPLVINLIGGPGSGKSTTMARLFGELKIRGINCEMASEYAKDKFYEESLHTLDDQIYIFGKQIHKIWRLKDKVDIIVMDTSLLASIVYDKTHNRYFKDLCLDQFNKTNNIVFYIKRNEVYQTSGRSESLSEAEAIDKAYTDLMNQYHIPYYCIENTEALDFILKTLEEKGYIKPQDK